MEKHPEKHERFDPHTILEFTFNAENGSLEAKRWGKSMDIDKTYQLLMDERSGQFAVISWPKKELEIKQTDDGYNQFMEPKGYRTSYGTFGHFEEVGLYPSPSSIEEKIKEIKTHDPLFEHQDDSNG